MNWSALLEKMSGRYWLAFVVCVWLFYVGKLDAENFKWIVTAFLAGGLGTKVADVFSEKR